MKTRATAPVVVKPLLKMGKLTEIPSTDPEMVAGDGFRGNRSLRWRLEGVRTTLAMKCKCGRWWGWVSEVAGISIQRSFATDGCVGCR